jgi:hypothetical protein
MTMDRTRRKRWGRWAATFVGFPLAGVAARAAAGNIDATGAAVVGGLAGGLVLGVVQAGVGGLRRGDRLAWIAASGVGLAAGLGLGASAVGYRTDTARLVAMGAICGAAVGVAQALSIRMRTIDRLLWAVATPVLWASGWLITSQVIVDAERQHAVFGSSGALAVSVAAGVLHAMRERPGRPAVPFVGAVNTQVAA